MQSVPATRSLLRSTIPSRVTTSVQAEVRHAELKKLGLEGKIVLIGKKGITYFNRRTNKYDIVGEPPAAQLPLAFSGQSV